MSDPLVPNFRVGTGRLTTDRFDFQDHVDGYKFRHHADQVDLFPTLVINSITTTTVQDALTQFAAAVLPPVIPDATTSIKGIIQLAGDITGTATDVIVSQLRGKPISTLVPGTNDVLTWDGYVWYPSPAVNTFVANGDIAGTNVLQRVIGLTGTAGAVSAACDTIDFINSISNPTITQTSTSSGNGTDLYLLAQSSSFASAKGGNVILSGGAAGVGGTKGGVKLQINTDNLLQAIEVASGQRVLSLFKTTDLNTTDMPASSGDMVMYIRDAASVPSFGSSPTNGSVVYSSGGQVHIMEASGNNFIVGSIPNPSSWGALGIGVGQTISYRQDAYTTTPAPQSFSYALNDNTATRIDVLLVGKQVGAAESAQFNLSMGYVRNGGGAPVAVGTLTNADARTTAGAAAWAIPNIILSVNNVVVQTGYSAANSIYWTVIVQLTMSKSA